VTRILKRGSATLAIAGLLRPTLFVAALANTTPSVTVQPNLNSTVSLYALSLELDPVVPNDEVIRLVRDKLKYVFVIFNENNSFDHEYGTFPGVNGIYSDGQTPRSASQTPGFNQVYNDVNGNSITVHPFRIGPQQNATFQDSVDHSHTGLAKKLDVAQGHAHMDGFSQDEYSARASSSASSVAAQAQGKQFAELVMSHIDCDTIPFFSPDLRNDGRAGHQRDCGEPGDLESERHHHHL
jgi:phospholipase C